jgi:hypothetical protein
MSDRRRKSIEHSAAVQEQLHTRRQFKFGFHGA